MRSGGRARRIAAGCALVCAGFAAADEPLPLLPIALQTTDAEQNKSSPKRSAIPEASETSALPMLAPPKTVAPAGPALPALPEASTASDGDGLVSKLAAGARASQAGTAVQPNPAAPTAIVAPVYDAPLVGELLQQASCVSLHHTSAINLDVRTRGYNAAQINATAAGINQSKTRIDIDPLYSQIDAGLVSAATVIDGPYSSLYGPGFAFLVADLKAPQRFETPQGRMASTLGYETNGSQLFWRQDAAAGGRTWGFLSSFGQRIGNDYTPGGDLFRIPASYNQWDGCAAFSLDVGCGQTIDLFYLHNEQNNVELPGVAYDLRQSTNHQFSLRYALWEGEERTERVVLQTWATDTHYRGDSAAASKQATMFGRLIGVPFGPFNDPTVGQLAGLLNDGGLSTAGARGYVRLGDPDCWELIVGADWRLERTFYRETDFDPAGGAAFGGNVFGIPRSSAQSAGAFFNLTNNLSPALSVTTGGRFDVWRAEFDAEDTVVTAGDPAVYPTSLFAGTNEPQQFLGMGYLTVKQRLGEFVSLSGGTAYAMRPPGLAELYSDRPWTPMVRFGNSISMGDSDLKPERLLQFDLGAKGEWPGLTLGIRGFVSNINDYILYRPLAPGAGAGQSINGNGPSALGRQIGAVAITDDAAVSYQYVNLARAMLLGGDLCAEWRPEPWVILFGSLEYVKGTNEDPLVLQADGSYKPKNSEGLPGIAPVSGVAGVRFVEAEHERYGIELNTRFAARQNRLAESLGELGTPGYAVWNLRGWVKIGERVTIASGVRNIFNRNYTPRGSLAIADPRSGAILFVPEPGVSWTASVEVAY